MVRKHTLYLLGLVTLLVFPIPAFLAVYYISDVQLIEFLQLSEIKLIPILYGLEFGFLYAFLAAIVLKAPIFDTIPLKIDRIVQDLNINVGDALFLSLCAGIGEELLFRSGMQTYFGVWFTSIFFVAIHGYFSIKKPKMSLYGMVVLPFILLISWGFEHFGLWFSIAAHFSYDVVLFMSMIHDNKKLNAQ
jgi:membrane protease YdiL (CAAX protease family)